MNQVSDRTVKVLSYLRGKVCLSESVEELQSRYKAAQPFPHLVLDNLFLPETLDAMLDELTPPTSPEWVDESGDRLKKYNSRSAAELGEKASQFTAMLHSAAFLYLITELTGVKALLPDPYMAGGAYHVYPEGGKFDVHADRNTDQVTGLFRSSVLLIYLNKNWKSENGGQLELWSQDGTKCEKSIEPIYNRSVLFEIGDKNFHGVRPITPGCGAFRRSFVAYFHTTGKGVAPHNSIYAPSIYRDKVPVMSRVAREVLPPILFRAVKGVKDRY